MHEKVSELKLIYIYIYIIDKIVSCNLQSTASENTQSIVWFLSKQDKQRAPCVSTNAYMFCGLINYLERVTNTNLETDN